MVLLQLDIRKSNPRIHDGLFATYRKITEKDLRCHQLEIRELDYLGLRQSSRLVWFKVHFLLAAKNHWSSKVVLLI